MSNRPKPSSLLAERLRCLRKQKGLTQTEIAHELHIHRSTYAYYETGKTAPDYNTLLFLCNAFGVPIEYLLGAPALSHSTDSQSLVFPLDKRCQLAPDELALLMVYRRLGAVQKRLSVSYICQFYDKR